ncbi:MAG: triose-phosphate isomerase [Defluviicoccus sp.]|nr:triose-phosphate isomerase [Defluviicoccus sp.]
MDSARPLVAGNWKMNGSRAMTRDLLASLGTALDDAGGAPCEIVVCPPAPYLADAARALASIPGIGLGAQDCHGAASGAHTGDVAAEMLADLGCRYAIVGHSERRGDHGEDSATVRAKAAAALAAGLGAIVCVGEPRADREAGRAEAVVGEQLDASLPDGANAENCVIAYEPVWAIGTGLTPTPAQIGEIHAAIRARLADGVRILYGGSVKPENAAAILAVADVDGALVGGASLDADAFWSICRSCP